jgi:hypothetical protein
MKTEEELIWESYQNIYLENDSIDSEYMESINSGNIDKTQAIIDIMAKKIKGQRGYHATYSKFNIFNTKPKNTTFGALLGRGAYITTVFERAKNYKKNIMGGYILDLYVFPKKSLSIIGDNFYSISEIDKKNILNNLKNQYTGDLFDPIPDAISLLKGDVAKDVVDDGIPEIIREAIESVGFDSIKSKQNGGFDYVMFNPNQIKLASPITYDDNNKIIPLSQRFNLNNEDIRF